MLKTHLELIKIKAPLPFPVGDLDKQSTRLLIEIIFFGILYMLYNGDLNSQLVWYSDHGDLFSRQMVHYLDTQYHGSVYSDHHLLLDPFLCIFPLFLVPSVPSLQFMTEKDVKW